MLPEVDRSPFRESIHSRGEAGWHSLMPSDEIPRVLYINVLGMKNVSSPTILSRTPGSSGGGRQ